MQKSVPDLFSAKVSEIDYKHFMVDYTNAEYSVEAALIKSTNISMGTSMK
jgi:hypothetical protein